MILVRNDTTPDDIQGMLSAEGILTVKGGMTSHAAVVARGIGKACICGTSKLQIDVNDGIVHVKDTDITLKKGDIITINGNTGDVILGYAETKQPDLSHGFKKIMQWAQEAKTVKIKVNADTPNEAKIARQFGAEGIGLCRTEHMFFNGERKNEVVKMIIATTEDERQEALSQILPMQVSDFEEIFQEMDGLPVNIRLLDPPLHEFLPQDQTALDNTARFLNISVSKVKSRVNEMREVNPMLGHRGCRLGISHESIYRMQVEAILIAACNVKKSYNTDIILDIMVPFVVSDKEFLLLYNLIKETADSIIEEKDIKIDYKIGTMIELPSAALNAESIAKYADFFCFGTNDLTQTTLGISRDDSAGFVEQYIQRGIFKTDPFVEIEINSVGKLVEFATRNGKKAKKSLEVGVCGEHGGNPESVYFFCKQDIDYISCSTFRVPVAILAAAQASIKRNSSMSPGNKIKEEVLCFIE